MYKYYAVLQNTYGGMLLNSDRAVIPEFRKDIKELKPALIFCRGDWLQYFELAIELKIPYILIEQDVHSLRTKLGNRQLVREKKMIENAAGLIFTSEDHVAYCQDNYDMPENYVVIHLRPLKQDIAWAPKEKLPGKHLVYAGGLVESAIGGHYGYRCYTEIFKAFTKAGWTVHIYAASKTQYNIVRRYHTSIKGTEPHRWLPYPELLYDMSQYTVGLQAYAKVNVNERAFAYTQTCRPNKTWDYLAAGIPTIGLNPGNCAKIYQEGGWGIVVPDTERSTLENIELPSFPDSLRFEQVMENDLPLFEQVIDVALGKKKVAKKAKTVKPSFTKTEEGEEEGMDDSKQWYRLVSPVIENGRLLHGRGKRIPMKEAIRLGLVKKEVIVKDKLERRAEKKKDRKKKQAKKEEIETKPLVEEGSIKKAFKEEDIPGKKKEVTKLTHKLSLEVINKKKEGEN